jgi:hypothetical protein
MVVSPDYAKCKKKANMNSTAPHVDSLNAHQKDVKGIKIAYWTLPSWMVVLKGTFNSEAT